MSQDVNYVFDQVVKGASRKILAQTIDTRWIGAVTLYADLDLHENGLTFIVTDGDETFHEDTDLFRAVCAYVDRCDLLDHTNGRARG